MQKNQRIRAYDNKLAICGKGEQRGDRALTVHFVANLVLREQTSPTRKKTFVSETIVDIEINFRYIFVLYTDIQI